jgi:hypothetical protein
LIGIGLVSILIDIESTEKQTRQSKEKEKKEQLAVEVSSGS